MVAIEDVRASNSALKSFPANLVAVFVGGTSGIGLYTARELVRNTISPRLYLIGRNQTEATKIIEELKTINSSSEVSFIQKDVSLLKNVDEACQDIKAKEKQVNLLFMTCGYVTFQGRTETSEGLDKKFALHYYTRMRFINQLQPLLDAAAHANSLSRVVSVLDPQPGLKMTPKWSDLSLKTSFSLKNCMVNATGMTNLAFYSLASKYPGTSYIHAYPHIVDTGAGRDAFGAFEPIAKPIMWLLRTAMQVKPVESGERHLYASTSSTFAPKAAGESVKDAAVGSDAVRRSGSYLLYWNNDVLDDKPVAKTMREEGREKEVLQHTEEVFNKICSEGGKY